MVSPQVTYEAGPNGNEVLGPNPGTNILTTNHMSRIKPPVFHVATATSRSGIVLVLVHLFELDQIGASSNCCDVFGEQ